MFRCGNFLYERKDSFVWQTAEIGSKPGLAGLRDSESHSCLARISVGECPYHVVRVWLPCKFLMRHISLRSIWVNVNKRKAIKMSGTGFLQVQTIFYKSFWTSHNFYSDGTGMKATTALFIDFLMLFDLYDLKIMSDALFFFVTWPPRKHKID